MSQKKARDGDETVEARSLVVKAYMKARKEQAPDKLSAGAPLGNQNSTGPHRCGSCGQTTGCSRRNNCVEACCGGNGDGGTCGAKGRRHPRDKSKVRLTKANLKIGQAPPPKMSALTYPTPHSIDNPGPGFASLRRDVHDRCCVLNVIAAAAEIGAKPDLDLRDTLIVETPEERQATIAKLCRPIEEGGYGPATIPPPRSIALWGTHPYELYYAYVKQRMESLPPGSSLTIRTHPLYKECPSFWDEVDARLKAYEEGLRGREAVTAYYSGVKMERSTEVAVSRRALNAKVNSERCTELLAKAKLKLTSLTRTLTLTLTQGQTRTRKPKGQGSPAREGERRPVQESTCRQGQPLFSYSINGAKRV